MTASRTPALLAEVAGELGRGAADVDEEVEERRVRLHQREELHARGEAREEGVERGEGGVGGGGLGDAAEELGLEAAEDGAGALGAEGGQALPRRHAGAGGVGVGEDRVGGGGGRRGAVLGEEGLGQLLHAGEAGGEGGGEGGGVGAAEGGEAGEAFGALGEALGLGVLEHLQAVLDLAVGDVGLRELVGGGAVDPALGGEGGEGGEGGALAEVGVAAADDELAGLGEELDLADAAAAELDVVAGDGERAPERTGEALVGADAQPHVVGVLDRPEVHVLAPDEGAEAVEEGPAGGESRRRRGGP